MTPKVMATDNYCTTIDSSSLEDGSQIGMDPSDICGTAENQRVQNTIQPENLCCTQKGENGCMQFLETGLYFLMILHYMTGLIYKAG